MPQHVERAPATYDQLVDAIPVPVMRFGAEGRCAHVNSAWCALTGLARETALGEGWLAVVHPDDRARCRAWHRPGRPSGPPIQQEFRLLRQDGSTPTVSSNVAPLEDAGGALGHLCVCVDVTERVESEILLRSLTPQYRERIKELDCLYGLADIVERAGGSIEEILRSTVELLPRWRECKGARRLSH